MATLSPSTEIPPSPKRRKFSSSTPTNTQPITQQPYTQETIEQQSEMPRDPKIIIAESTKLQSTREAELGITYYVIKDAPGFAGTLKQRYVNTALISPALLSLHRIALSIFLRSCLLPLRVSPRRCFLDITFSFV